MWKSGTVEELLTKVRRKNNFLKTRKKRERRRGCGLQQAGPIGARSTLQLDLVVRSKELGRLAGMFYLFILKFLFFWIFNFFFVLDYFILLVLFLFFLVFLF